MFNHQLRIIITWRLLNHAVLFIKFVKEVYPKTLALQLQYCFNVPRS